MLLCPVGPSIARRRISGDEEAWTPIPYKIVTITSGFAGYDVWLFILFSLISRGGRFFIAAVLLNRYGETIRQTIEARLGFWVAVGTIVLIAGIIVAIKLI